MSFNFSTVGANGPTPTAPVNKDVVVKAVKLTYADFSTGGTAAVKAYLPADASVIGIKQWVKTQLSGNSISAATLSIGITGTATKYLNAQSVFGAAGTAGNFTAGVGNIFQEYDPAAPGGDVPLLFTGTATTGNPTAGEIYILIEYIR